MASPRNMGVPLVPVSLEAVRQKVMATVHLTESETKLFLERYLPRVGNVSAWPSLVEAICGRHGKNSAYLHDFKDMETLMDKVKEDRLITQHVEFTSLRRMAERARVFEYLAFSLRDNLSSAYETLLKRYCKSFLSEVPSGMEILCVREHENKISFWDNQVRDRLELLDSILDEIHRYASPFMKYVHHYEKMMQLMEEACNMMVLACDPIRKWVSADALYARKVQYEINLLHKRKMELIDSVKQDEYENERLGLQLKRKTYDAQNVERNLNEVRTGMGQLKNKESELLDQKSKVRLMLTQKKQELDKIRSKIKNRRENTPSIFAYLTGASEILREDIRAHDFHLDSLHLQINRLQKEQFSSQRKVDRLSQDLQASFQVYEENVARLRKQVEDVGKVKADVEHLDSMIKTLKRIRELKMNGNTVKKIYHAGHYYQLAPLVTNRGDVDRKLVTNPKVSYSMSQHPRQKRRDFKAPLLSKSVPVEAWRSPTDRSLGYTDRYVHHVKDLQKRSLVFTGQHRTFLP